MNNKIYIAVVAVLLAAAALGAWYFFMRVPGERVGLPEVQTGVDAPPATAEELGAQLLEKSQNPLKDELPQTNPFEAAETNPFIGVYENPFAK